MKGAPLLLASPRYLRELQQQIADLGRTCVTVTRDDRLARTYRASNAFIAIVDARGALEPGIEMVRALAQAVEERRGGLLVLLSRTDAPQLPAIYEAGATHYLVSPFGIDQLDTALMFVSRTISRMRASGLDAAVAGAQAALHRSARWQWRLGSSEVAISPDLAEVLGLRRSTESITLRTALGYLGQKESARVRSKLELLVAGQVDGTFEHKVRLGALRRRLRHHVHPTTDSSGEVVSLSASVEDVEESEQQQQLSMHYDPLTGLRSLTNLTLRLDGLFAANPDGDAAVLVLIGVSKLEQVNAAHGREVADELLQAVARRLQRLLADRGITSATAARVGGAEFGVLFPAPTDISQAVLLSQLVIRIFQRPSVIQGLPISLACRIGIAASEPGMQRADELLHLASSALSSARDLGPNSFQVYLPGGDADPARLALLETSVREAMQTGTLDIRYQPQVDITTGAIVGVEALVRLEHQELGTLQAETLLAAADRGDFGIALGRSIMRQACREAAAWPKALSNVRLSVNVTAADIKDSEFVSATREILADTGFPSARLTLEITESGLLDDLHQASSLLSSLKREKIRVAIDDFGTGYSSLAYLTSLPLDYLKIDKKIAADIMGKGRDQIVVRGVVDMARSLDMIVIAEGVETEEQLDLLAREGCNWYQGYLCAEPLAINDLPGFVETWNSVSEESPEYVT